jgi:D-serine dehydratase
LKYRQEILPEQFESAVHLVWSTGGNMVPEGEMSAYLSRGNFLLEKFVS